MSSVLLFRARNRPEIRRLPMRQRRVDHLFGVSHQSVYQINALRTVGLRQRTKIFACGTHNRKATACSPRNILDKNNTDDIVARETTRAARVCGRTVTFVQRSIQTFSQLARQAEIHSWWLRVTKRK